MADIEEGDQVSWKYGRGTTEGTVAEIKTSGQLAIESKDKEIKVNASEDNPGVHVARDDNDVVKRASSLHKEIKGDEKREEGEPVTDNQESTAKKVETGIGEEVHGKGVHVQQTEVHSRKEETEPETDDEVPENGVSNGKEDTNEHTVNGKENQNEEHVNGHTNRHANGHANGHSPLNGDIMDTTPDKAKVEVGGKRPREEEDGDNNDAHHQNKKTREEERAEVENGKEIKKAKLDIEEKTANGDHHQDHPRKPQTADTEASPKKKPGRPKRSESEMKVHGEDTAENVSARTRSKA